MNVIKVTENFGRRWSHFILALVAVGTAGAAHAAAPADVRVRLFAPAEAKAELTNLRAAVTATAGIRATESLQDADVAVIWRGPGALDATESAALQQFLRSGQGVVLLGADVAAWPGK